MFFFKNILRQELEFEVFWLEDQHLALQNPITNSIIFGAWRFTFTIQDYSDREYSFFHIGDGLTDYEAKALYWIVQKFQTTLGRQVY